MGVVQRYAEIGQMIEAQERIAAVMDVAAGTGSLKKNDARAHIRELRAQARGPRRRQRAEAITRRSPQERRVELAQFGIAVVEEKAG